MNLRWRRRTPFALLVALAVVAASCGNDADDGPSATDGDDGTGDEPELAADFPTGDLGEDLRQLLGEPEVVEGETTRGVTDDTIRVGGVSSITAGGEPVFFGMCEGAQARINRANADGELSREIDFVDCVDDSSDQDTNRDAVEQLVLSDEVFALLPTTSQAFFSEDFLNEERVPYMGWGFQPAYCGFDKPFAFGHTGSAACPPDLADDHLIISRLIPQAYIEALEVDDPSALRVAVITEDAPTGEAGLDIIRGQSELEGFDVVYAEAAAPPPTAPPPASWAPFASDIIGSDPDVVFLTTSQTAVIGLSPELRAQGYEGDIVQFVFADQLIFAAPELAEVLDTTIAVMQGVGVDAFGGEDWDQVAADAATVGFEDLCCGTGFTHGYGSADLFVQAAAAYEETLGEGDPFTAEGFANFVNQGYAYPGFGNVICQGDWPQSHIVGSPCASVVQWDTPNQTLVPLLDLQTFDPTAVLED